MMKMRRLNRSWRETREITERSRRETRESTELERLWIALKSGEILEKRLLEREAVLRERAYELMTSD